MYYETKLFQDGLYCRSTPNGDWLKCDYDQLLRAYKELVSRIEAGGMK
jgi:hypothetical protein